MRPLLLTEPLVVATAVETTHALADTRFSACLDAAAEFALIWQIVALTEVPAERSPRSRTKQGRRRHLASRHSVAPPPLADMPKVTRLYRQSGTSVDPDQVAQLDVLVAQNPLEHRVGVPIIAAIALRLMVLRYRSNGR